MYIFPLYIYFCISNCINNDSFFVIYLTKLLLFWYFHGKNILFFIQFILTTIHFIYNLHPEKHHCLVFLLFCFIVFSYYLVSQKRCNNIERQISWARYYCHLYTLLSHDQLVNCSLFLINLHRKGRDKLLQRVLGVFSLIVTLFFLLLLYDIYLLVWQY